MRVSSSPVNMPPSRPSFTLSQDRSNHERYLSAPGSQPVAVYDAGPSTKRMSTVSTRSMMEPSAPAAVVRRAALQTTMVKMVRRREGEARDIAFEVECNRLSAAIICSERTHERELSVCISPTSVRQAAAEGPKGGLVPGLQKRLGELGLTGRTRLDQARYPRFENRG